VTLSRLVPALAAIAVAVCVGTAPGRSARPAAPGIPVEVAVARAGERWTADFHFRRASPAWVFARSPLARESGKPWRPESWTIETPGVRLERHGHYDVLVGKGGAPVPERVRIRFTPFAKDILTDYDAALVFTDGSVALFDQQFKAFPVESAAVASALPLDLGEVAAAGPPTRTIFRDGNRGVLHQGRRHATLSLDDAGTYVLFGPARPIVTGAISAIFDPALPAWLRTYLARSTPEILADYAQALGPAPKGRPTVMVSWAGPTPKLVSMGGSVLPNLVTMTFEGEGVTQERADVRNRARWFIAHESAHFWLGQTVSYASSREAWITEGGADLLAIRTVAKTDPGYDSRTELQGLLDECIGLIKGRGIESAPERNEPRTAYACGAIFGTLAEGASGRPFAAWIRPLIEANRRDGVLSRAEWLAALARSPKGAQLRRGLERLLDRGAEDPAAAFAQLFSHARIPHRFDDQGKLLLL
jgi:hypothetical protein